MDALISFSFCMVRIWNLEMQAHVHHFWRIKRILHGSFCFSSVLCFYFSLFSFFSVFNVFVWEVLFLYLGLLRDLHLRVLIWHLKKQRKDNQCVKQDKESNNCCFSLFLFSLELFVHILLLVVYFFNPFLFLLLFSSRGGHLHVGTKKGQYLDLGALLFSKYYLTILGFVPAFVSSDSFPITLCTNIANTVSYIYIAAPIGNWEIA